MEEERTDPIGMDFTESGMHLDDLPSYESLARDTDMPESPFARTYPMEDFELPPSDLGHAKEPFEAPLEKPDGQSCDVIEPLTETTCESSNILEIESGHAQDKQKEITAMEKPDEVEGDTKDKSGMSAYFETTTIKTDAAGSQGEGYYELSTTLDEQKDSLGNLPLPEISYSTLAQTHSLEVNPDLSQSTADTLKTSSPVDRRDDCRLSPGKLALEQRSYSLNITIGAMDHDAQGRPRNFSPLATDIMSHTSGSLDESADYLPATTPSVDKTPQFPPLILETTASVTPSSPPPQTTASDENGSPRAESPESPVPAKGCYKNGTVMAPDLPEMLDLAGTRSRLASDNADPEILRRKSVPMDMTSIVSDSLAHLLKGDPSQMAAKREMQLEEQGYCVFSEYSGPMPSPADVYSPMDVSPQIFNTVISEEKELGFVASGKEGLLGEDLKTEELAAPPAKAEDEMQSKEDSFDKESAVAEKPTTETKQDEVDPFKAETEEIITLPENEKEQLDKPAETFITPKVTVTVEEAKPDLDAKFAETEAEIADYERQIRKLEMEDRPLSVEEERELQELREKVKNKPDLVHQEAYEEVDAEDVYQLTGVAKDRIARPLRPSPASSVESATDEEKIHFSEIEKPKSPEALKTDPNRLSPVGSFEKYFREERPSEQEVKQKDTVESLKEKAVEPQPDPSKTEEKPSEQQLIQKDTTVEPPEEKAVEEQPHPAPSDTAEAPVDTTATQEVEEDVEIAEEPEEIIPETKPAPISNLEEKPVTDETEPGEIAVEKDEVNIVGNEEVEEEVLEGAKAAEDVVESRAAIESVVTVEDDFITVVQTIDEGEVSGHSVRFSAPTEEEHPQPLQEEEEESVEMAQEVEMEAASLEEILDVPEEVEPPVCPVKEAEVQESEAPTQSYDDYKDETTIDDSILDSSWVDTQGAILFC